MTPHFHALGTCFPTAAAARAYAAGRLETLWGPPHPAELDEAVGHCPGPGYCTLQRDLDERRSA